jgi:hypothetical protein
LELNQEPVTLLEAAAREAFWKLPVTWLRQLASHLHLPLVANDLGGLVLPLLKHCLPNATVDDLLVILPKRANPKEIVACALLIQAKEMECLPGDD